MNNYILWEQIEQKALARELGESNRVDLGKPLTCLDCEDGWEDPELCVSCTKELEDE
jgi:hypothetical protein